MWIQHIHVVDTLRLCLCWPQIEYYCHKIRWGEGGSTVQAVQPAHVLLLLLGLSHMVACAPAGCPKINRLAIDRFRFGLQWCLAKAVDLVSRSLSASTFSGSGTAGLLHGLRLLPWHCHKPS